MATREIKTTIALDGEQKFKESIKQINKEFRVLDSEMKVVSSQYDVTGNKATFLAEKQSILATKLSTQKDISSATRQMLKKMEDAYEEAGKRLEKLRADLTKATETGDDKEIKLLTEAVKKAESAFATAASKIQDYQIQLNSSVSKENRLQTEINQTKKAIEAADREVEELGRDSVRAGRQLEQGIGEGAEEAEKDVRSLIQTMKEDLSSIRTSTTFTAVGNLWNMAKDAYSSASGFVEQTAEYRRQLSFLEQNASTSGFDFSEIKKQLVEVQTFTGEATTAVEGLSNLLAIDPDDRQMKAAIDSLAGAVITFPETHKFESLADGLQETIATGEATGAFAELLGRLGVNVEDFNTALENSETQAGDVEIALAYLADHGLKDVYKQWQLNNQELVEAQQTQAELDAELAEFGGHLENYIVTPVKELLVDALAWVNDTVAKETEKWEEWKADTTGKNAEVLNPLDPNDWKNDQGSGRKYYQDPNRFTSIAQMKEASRKSENAAIEWMKATYANGNYFMPTDQWRTDTFKWVTEAQLSVMGAVGAITKRLQFAAREEGKDAATAFAEGWAEIEINEAEASEAEGVRSKIKKAGTSNWQDVLKEIESMAPELKDSSEEAGDAAVEGFETGVSSMPANAYRNGAEAIEQLAAGMRSRISYVAMAAAQVAAAASGGTRGVGTAVSGAAAAINAVLNIDGTEFARITAPYMSAQLAVQ